MGTDIHWHVERRDGDAWTRAEPFVRDDSVIPGDPPRTRRWQAYWVRDYWLFGLLAGIRGDEPPIVAPRGLPSDVSAETLEDHADFGADAHTESWLTIGELMSYDWTRIESRRAPVNDTYVDGRGGLAEVVQQRATADLALPSSLAKRRIPPAPDDDGRRIRIHYDAMLISGRPEWADASSLCWSGRGLIRKRSRGLLVRQLRSARPRLASADEVPIPAEAFLL